MQTYLSTMPILSPQKVMNNKVMHNKLISISLLGKAIW